VGYKTSAPGPPLDHGPRVAHPWPKLPDHLWTTGHGLHTPGLSYAVFVARQSYQRGIFAMVLKWSFHHH